MTRDDTITLSSDRRYHKLTAAGYVLYGGTCHADGFVGDGLHTHVSATASHRYRPAIRSAILPWTNENMTAVFEHVLNHFH